MNKTPRASLTIYRRPNLAPGATRYEVGCKFGTTGLTSIPTPVVALTDKMLITAAAYVHQERCGGCDLGDVFTRGDQQMRELTEELWPKIQGALLMRARRN